MAELPTRAGDVTERATPPFTFGRALFAVVAGFFIAHLLGVLAAQIARSLLHVAPGVMTPGVIVPSMLASEGGLLLVSVLVPLTAAKPVRAGLGLHSAPLPVFVAAAVGTVTLGPVGDRLMTLLSELFPDLTLGVVPALHELARSLPLPLLWPTFALLPGLAEELLFRGVLQRSIPSRRVGIVVAGCAFALFHVDPVHVIGVLPLGLFLSWAAARSCTTVSVFAHVVNNSIALLSIQNADLDVGYGSDKAVPTEWVITSLVLFACAAYALARMTSDSSTENRAAQPSATL
jgi:membrane protease YdiL (CAAX protease family)